MFGVSPEPGLHSRVVSFSVLLTGQVSCDTNGELGSRWGSELVQRTGGDGTRDSGAASGWLVVTRLEIENGPFWDWTPSGDHQKDMLVRVRVAEVFDCIA